MNPIQYALNEIHSRIPSEILKIGFQRGFRNDSVSLDERISIRVIRQRVLITSDLIGGREINIPLAGIQPEIIDNYTAIYDIPLNLSLGVPIIALRSSSYAPTGYMAYQQASSYNATNNLANAASNIFNSHSTMPIVSTARIELVGENMVEVRDNNGYMPLMALTCLIANDPDLNNLQRRSYPIFAKACELAVKAYLYNHLLVDLDQAYLRQGQALDTIKSIIESYSDAEEQYQLFMTEKMQKIFMMNDENRFHKHIRSMVSIGF